MNTIHLAWTLRSSLLNQLQGPTLRLLRERLVPINNSLSLWANPNS